MSTKRSDLFYWYYGHKFIENQETSSLQENLKSSTTFSSISGKTGKATEDYFGRGYSLIQFK